MPVKFVHSSIISYRLLLLYVYYMYNRFHLIFKVSPHFSTLIVVCAIVNIQGDVKINKFLFPWQQKTFIDQTFFLMFGL